MRRSLSNVGGPCEIWGNDGLAHALAACLDVDPDAKLPLTHGFHAYPARMHPEIARRAIAKFAPKRVLDPFVGSGTTALEAVRAGLPFIGLDVLRVALEIAWVRTRVWVPDDARRLEREGRRIAAQAPRSPRPPADWPDAEWFSPHTLGEIAALKDLVEATKPPDVRRALVVVLSSLLVKLSRQARDSVPVHDRGYRPWPPGTAYRLFRDKCSVLTKNLLLLSSDLHKRKVKPVEPDLRLADARTANLDPKPGDLVLTSPPYPGTYDYAHHHRLRHALFGDDVAFAEQHEIGARRAFDARRYREDLRVCLTRLRTARVLVLIGDGRDVRADRLLRELFPVAAIASQERVDWTTDRRKREHLVLIDP